jgi:hypothetical protein
VTPDFGQLGALVVVVALVRPAWRYVLEAHRETRRTVRQ